MKTVRVNTRLSEKLHQKLKEHLVKRKITLQDWVWSHAMKDVAKS